MNRKLARTGGFTLMELMIAVAIVGILAAIAYPTYQSHIIKTRRAAASACLTELSHFMERHYTTNMSYEDAELPETQCQDDLTEFYTFAFDGEPDAATFSITATAEGAQQSGDTKCGNLTLDQTGTKSVSVSGTEVSSCF